MKKTHFRFLYLFAVIPFLTFSADLAVETPAPQILRTACRERQCLNGYWKFYPLYKEDNVEEKIPAPGSGWGAFKVPGVWTGAFRARLPEERVRKEAWHSAWYARDFLVPKSAGGKRAILSVEHIQTRAEVHVDGRKAGTILFPGGDLDITPFIRPGHSQTLQLLVTSLPLKSEHYSIMDGNNVFKIAAEVAIKGINGDVFLHLVPESRIDGTQFITSTRNRTITFSSELNGLRPGVAYAVGAELFDRNGKKVRKFVSKPFRAEDTEQGVFRFTASWSDPELWDLHTPQNLYTGVMTLFANGKLLDITLPERFGFREFRIEGRNYLLNDTVIHLRSYFLSNFCNQWETEYSSKSSARSIYERLRQYGFNFTISKNYNFKEGAVAYLRGTFDAADEFGHLWSFSLPHPWQFGDLTRPENLERFMGMAGYLIRKYRNHPSIVLWVSNHNHGGAWGDQNPLRIGGEYKRANARQERETKEKARDNFLALQKRVVSLDPSRPVYSHASGSLGGQYSLNAYFNWAPCQERSDWLEHFSRHGRYPLSFVEYGLPHVASFSSYRGPGFIWNEKAEQTSWDAEYCAAEYGDRTAEWTPERLRLLDRFVEDGAAKVHFGRYCLLERFQQVNQIQADYFRRNLPALRAWGIGLMLPWDYPSFFRRNTDNFPLKPNPDRLKGLNEPGIVPDNFRWGDYFVTPYPQNYTRTAIGDVVHEWNQPLIAWIGGGESFTTQEHNYRPGDTVRKQLVILNDLRTRIGCSYSVRIKEQPASAVRGDVEIAPGGKALIPVALSLPPETAPGSRTLIAEFQFDNGEKRSHTFPVHILPAAAVGKLSPVALYDPKGETEALLKRLGIPFRKIAGIGEAAGCRTLIIGRKALSATGALPDLSGVRDGQNVLIFEQETAVLKRLGFRWQEYGLRKLFPRLDTHPALTNLEEAHLSDWHGESTLLPPYLDYDQFFCPKQEWCGFSNSRVWRCRNRGVVAHVLMEKPSVGCFRPILDGGFALQYAPLLEYREGKGTIVVCQLEVAARTVNDPAADELTVNLVRYIRQAKPLPARAYRLIAGAEFRDFLNSFRLKGEDENADLVLVGPGAERYPDLTETLRRGGTVIALGLSEAELKNILPGLPVKTVLNSPSQLADLSAPEFAGINNQDTAFQTRLNFAGIRGRDIAADSVGGGRAVVIGVIPQMLDQKIFRLRAGWRRRAFLISQVLRNAGIASDSVLLDRFACPPQTQPYKNSFYLQEPISADDPYCYYHW